ncbi:hypothetical protein JX265_004542 [Neoarthrinium moseri]|uniref:M protein, serotype 2.1 n=1 Tax=Neoarthrinium moseri TaxID=1658444 RepID=A0A9P9WR79_9PEZI|nr:uncharacterized protein JN550_008138 [Neoarthrinium moseri]KAI1851010.1 hypothetical protein JX266_003675 [Neoarthrinium moseri]KAI1865880.1 hypothetical protein JN550_008138 [Neoarthrinium moseri]KAI1875484.1 hypothetical protein JX265_004542 [Neoarthrinium moseri]
MSAATRKPPSAGTNRLNDNNTASPSPSRQPRTSTPTSSVAGAQNATPTRTRSTRTGTPVSARAAAHRGSSSLSISTTEAEEVLRAEAAAVVEDLKARLEKADATSEQYRKQAEVLQSRLEDALKEQAKLEERVHESEEQIEALRNEKRESARQIREMETIYEAEKSKILKEKEEMANREEEMQAVINRLKDTINQRNAEDEYRPTRQSNTSSPTVDNGNFAPPSSINRSDSRNNSKLLLQKDKLIESLRLELAEAQIKLVESENQGGGRLHEVERLLMEARMANARLMEDNESYQLLLQEKTLHGDFGKGDFSYMGMNANQDALSALEGRPSSGGNKDLLGSNSLADELGDMADESAISHVDDADHQRRLEGELRALKDQNKALTLYINKIIERLLQHQEFEHILDQSSDAKSGANVNKDLPAPPSDQGAAASLLQRAKSIAMGGKPAEANPKPRQRPLTFMPSSTAAHHNPDTAPSIPIGMSRSASTRRPGGRPMSEQFAGAAGIVNAMYKGPDGPLSPSLSNPRNSAQFFSGTGTPRLTSSSSGAPTAGNFPGMRSETSSVSGDSAADGTSASQSPPRTVSSGHSHGDKQATFAGNKPRPLRLVQENPDMKGADAQNKRASWFGWAGPGWGGKKPEEGETIKE